MFLLNVFETDQLLAVGDIAQVKSVEYWGKTFTKGTGKKEEQEERIFSNKSELAPLAKYVNAIHLFLNDLENKFTRQVFIDIRKFNTVPIYIYDNPDYFMSQVKSKAMTDKQLDAALGTATDMTDDEKAQYNDTEHTRWGADSIKAMMQIYNGEKSDSEAYKRVFDLLTRYKYDALGSLDADIHNNKFKHLPIFIDLAKAMRKEKITNVADFIKLLMKKADEMREI